MHHTFMDCETPPDDKLVNLLGAVAVVVHDALTEAGLSDSRASAIICVGSHPNESIEDLSRTLRLSHSGTVRLVDRLERENVLLRTRAKEDRRTSRLRLSTNGTKEFNQLLERRRQAIGQLVGELPTNTATSLTQALETILGAKTSSKADARRTCRLCAEEDCRPRGCPVEIAAGQFL